MTPLSWQMIEENEWLYTDIQAEEILQSSEFILLHDFGKDQKLILYKPLTLFGHLIDFQPATIGRGQVFERYGDVEINPANYGTVTISGDISITGNGNIDFTPPTLNRE